MIKHTARALLAMALLCVAGFATATTPTRVASAKAGDCVACHKGDTVLPAKHKATRDMTWEACQKCHEPGTEDSLAGKFPSSHMHALADVGCADCHGKTRQPRPASREQCVTCHAIDKVVAATAEVKPENPHVSPHWGNEMECTACHVQHAKPVNYCAHCHDFEFKLP